MYKLQTQFVLRSNYSNKDFRSHQVNLTVSTKMPRKYGI